MITPYIPDRRQDAGPALQLAFDQSSKTGEPVQLSGTYIVNATLYLRGGHIIGQLSGNTDNWGNTSYTDKGNAVIYSRANGDALQIMADAAIHNLAITCQHATLKASSLASAIRVSGQRTALAANNILLDRANVGLTLEALTGEHDIENLHIRSPRYKGIYCPSPTTIVDSWFTKTYIAGIQYQDYTANPPPTAPLLVGIDGLPAASKWHGPTLIESCKTGIRCGVILDQYFADLKIDDSLGVGIELAPPFGGGLYAQELCITNFHFQASVSMEGYTSTAPGAGRLCVQELSDHLSLSRAPALTLTQFNLYHPPHEDRRHHRPRTSPT